MSTSVALQQEALTRATSSQSLANFATIIRGFMAKGLRESEILPRENVFTYNAWRALGRQVRKGEHGVRCLTFITTTNKRTGREERRPWSTTVFHISQTEKIGALACNEALDATAENIPYAGEAETDEAELQAHSDAVHASREQWTAAPVNTAELDAFAAAQPYTEPEVIPAPAPKDSAYDRAMRGETINIMDLIAEQSKPERAPRSINRPFGKGFQSKTVDF